jgi:Uncharacterized conserved protein
MPIADREHHLYQFAIIRADLEMEAGKLSAQAGHAYTDSLFKAYEHEPQRVIDYRNKEKGGSKVTLKAKNLNQLLKAYEQLQNEGIICALIVDQHHILPPHFTGEPIITAIGIGPVKQSEVRHITKKFQCVK